MQQAIGNNKQKKSKTQNINPFAKALAETEPKSGAVSSNKKDQNSLLSEALAKTGGNLPQENSKKDQKDLLKKQQEEQKAAAEKKVLRKKLHDRVNPVDQADVFSAREKQVKEEIDKLRYELKMLAEELGQLNTEIERTVMSEVAEPGVSGTYYINFFQRLRSFIMLLRQKVRSARTWANQMNHKKSKKRGRRGPGMVVGARETKRVHDTLHHERSNALSGG